MQYYVSRKKTIPTVTMRFPQFIILLFYSIMLRKIHKLNYVPVFWYSDEATLNSLARDLQFKMYPEMKTPF